MKVSIRALVKIVAVTGILSVAGCPSAPKDRNPNVFYGPTDTQLAVVNRINSNNVKLSTLWSNLNFQAWVIDENKKETYVSGDGVLLYREPKDFRLTCNDAVIGELLTLGTNRYAYWLTVKVRMETMWWGRTEFVGSRCAESVPIDPTLVSRVLGIGAITPDFINEPLVFRFDNDRDAYILSRQVRIQDRWAVQQDVWYDRKTMRPVRVLLYGDSGRVRLRADLSDHVPVRLENGKESGGVVASTFSLLFTDSGSRMILRLRDPLVSRKGFPKDQSFKIPLDNPGVAKVIQVDEACGP